MKKGKEKVKKKGKAKGKGKGKKTTEIDKETLARMKVEDHKRWYKLTWGTPVGQDCIDLRISLCTWLGERLAFFAEHTNTVLRQYQHDETDERMRNDLRKHAEALLRYAEVCNEMETEKDLDAAKQALEFVTANLRHMWD